MLQTCTTCGLSSFICTVIMHFRWWQPSSSKTTTAVSEANFVPVINRVRIITSCCTGMLFCDHLCLLCFVVEVTETASWNLYIYTSDQSCWQNCKCSKKLYWQAYKLFMFWVIVFRRPITVKVIVLQCRITITVIIALREGHIHAFKLSQMLSLIL